MLYWTAEGGALKTGWGLTNETMRYSIKRLFREHEEHKAAFDKLQNAYKEGEAAGLPYNEYAKNTTEMNRLRHAMSLCRQFIGQEVVARLKEHQNEPDYKEKDFVQVK